MAWRNNTGVARRLEELLTRERQALVAGRLSELDAMGTTKVRLLQQMTAETCPPDALRKLHADLMRNQALLTASARGVRTAIERLKAAGRPVELRTYDRDGQMKESARPARIDINRRA